jgi:carboxypeptidase Taq
MTTTRETRDALRARLAELTDLRALGMLAMWDQRTMMPAQGGRERGEMLATVERLAHERFANAEVGAWIEQLEQAGGELDEIDRDVVRLARRDFDKRSRVPADLAAELARASSEGQAAWEAAREACDVAAFVPALRRNVELAREYVACFDHAGEPYDVLLDDYDPGLTAAQVGELFAPLREQLPPLVDRGAGRPRPAVAPPFPLDAQRFAVDSLLRTLGAAEERWRLDESTHPFTAWVGPGDIRVTTRFDEGSLESVLAAVHEFGHGLYEQGIDPALVRTNAGEGTSMSMHESQSKLWENHVGRSKAFAGLLSRALADGGAPRLDPAQLHEYLVAVERSPIRVSADEVTYPLHIVLRFELERALFGGDLDAGDLEAAFADGLRELVGVAPRDANEGVLQDIHWAAGSFGYFPSYAIGCVIAAQLWERLDEDLDGAEEHIAAGDVGPLREWLRERVHRHGRRVDTADLVERATGRGLDVAPLLRHLARRAEGR